MIKYRKFILPALFIVLIVAVIAGTSGGHFYRVKVFESGQGWGYDILLKNKQYIHQPYMPAIEGEKPFSNKESALRTGRLVVKKLRAHKNPNVTREELKGMLSDSLPIP